MQQENHRCSSGIGFEGAKYPGSKSAFSFSSPLSFPECCCLFGNSKFEHADQLVFERVEWLWTSCLQRSSIHQLAHQPAAAAYIAPAYLVYLYYACPGSLNSLVSIDLISLTSGKSIKISSTDWISLTSGNSIKSSSTDWISLISGNSIKSSSTDLISLTSGNSIR